MVYAVRADVLEGWDSPPTVAGKLVHIDDLIDVASNELDAAVGFSFEKTASQTRYVRGFGGTRLHLHNGDAIAVLSTVSFLDSWGGTATLVDAADYVAEIFDPASGQYDHLVLGGTTSGYGCFPIGYRLIAVTAEFGFPTVPVAVTNAVIDRVRQLYHADPTMIGGIQGPDEMGRIIQSVRKPETFYSVVEHYRRRYATCHV